MRIGLDFDNTIVCYDEAVNIISNKLHKLPVEVERSKKGIRDYLRGVGRELDWTEFQGELYGPGMVYARPYKGAIETMEALGLQGHDLRIVSHRSRNPYAGVQYDLHAAAKDWIEKVLQKRGLFLPTEISRDNGRIINFMESRKAKLERIAEVRCDIFVDDLPEVLDAPEFPKNTSRVLFCPEGKNSNRKEYDSISSWADLIELVGRIS